MDFDFEDLEKYNEEDEEMEEYEYEDEEADGEVRVRPKKTAKKRVSRRSIFEIYEPSDLERSHLTDQDNEIRTTDLPERFQVGTACFLLGLACILNLISKYTKHNLSCNHRLGNVSFSVHNMINAHEFACAIFSVACVYFSLCLSQLEEALFLFRKYKAFCE